MRSAVIVAGGRSTRFGEADKAVATLGGTPMIRRVADRIEPVVDDVVVNCRRDQTGVIAEALDGSAHDVTYAEDDDPDEGPLAGMRTGLRATRGEAAFVVACDMPFVDPDLVAFLFDSLDGADAVVPELDGWLQTLQAVYAARPMAEAADTALERGERRITAALDELDYMVVDENEVCEYAAPASFENLNTREEFEAARRRL